MIEVRIKEYLDTAFENTGVSVYLETPDTLPEKFIVFQVIDRGKDNLIDAVTIEFSSFANSKYEAALLDEKLRGIIEDLHEGSDITFRLGGGSDETDTSLKKYRYRCFYNLYY